MTQSGNVFAITFPSTCVVYGVIVFCVFRVFHNVYISTCTCLHNYLRYALDYITSEHYVTVLCVHKQ